MSSKEDVLESVDSSLEDEDSNDSKKLKQTRRTDGKQPIVGHIVIGFEPCRLDIGCRDTRKRQILITSFHDIVFYDLLYPLRYLCQRACRLLVGSDFNDSGPNRNDARGRTARLSKP